MKHLTRIGAAGFRTLECRRRNCAWAEVQCAIGVHYHLRHNRRIGEDTREPTTTTLSAQLIERGSSRLT